MGLLAAAFVVVIVVIVIVVAVKCIRRRKSAIRKGETYMHIIQLADELHSFCMLMCMRHAIS